MISLILCILAISALVLALIFAVLIAIDPEIKSSEYYHVLALVIVGFVAGLLSLTI